MRDQYLPALIYCQPPKAKGKRKLPGCELYGAWEWASEQYEQLIAAARERMPAACAAGLEGRAEPDGLLRHCAEVLLDRTVRETPLPAVFTKKLAGSLLTACLDPQTRPWKMPGTGLEAFRHWRQWRRRITGTERDVAFTLGFRLVEPSPESEPTSGSDWALQFIAVPQDDPSQRLALADYWSASKAARERMREQLGKDFETHLLLNLGLAARMMPKLWEGLDTAEPQAVALNLDEAFDFLKESAWVLEDAGFKVIVPAWWTPQGRRRIKIRLRSSASKSASGTSTGARHVNLENLVRYSYQLAIGDQVVNKEEWQRLVASKEPGRNNLNSIA